MGVGEVGGLNWLRGAEADVRFDLVKRLNRLEETSKSSSQPDLRSRTCVGGMITAGRLLVISGNLPLLSVLFRTMRVDTNA